MPITVLPINEKLQITSIPSKKNKLFYSHNEILETKKNHVEYLNQYWKISKTQYRMKKSRLEWYSKTFMKQVWKYIESFIFLYKHLPILKIEK